jgi:REP element-mobilizing transposase RayT
MLLGHHLIMTAYGWWLPNDPRGSSSHEIRVEHLQGLGDLHHGHKALQPLPAELRAFYESAETVLKHPLLTFSDADLAELAAAFAETIRERRYTCYACALMPDHVHLLIRAHRDRAEAMLRALQDASRSRLRLRDLRPPVHPVWGGPGWKVFQSSVRQLCDTIRYIEDNPLKHRRPRQHWDFVTPYDGWRPGLR